MIKVFPWSLPFISFGVFGGILTDGRAASVLVWRRAEKRLNHWSVYRPNVMEHTHTRAHTNTCVLCICDTLHSLRVFQMSSYRPPPASPKKIHKRFPVTNEEIYKDIKALHMCMCVITNIWHSCIIPLYNIQTHKLKIGWRRSISVAEGKKKNTLQTKTLIITAAWRCMLQMQ